MEGTMELMQGLGLIAVGLVIGLSLGLYILECRVKAGHLPNGLIKLGFTLPEKWVKKDIKTEVTK
jgi:hypothetical protein